MNRGWVTRVALRRLTMLLASFALATTFNLAWSAEPDLGQAEALMRAGRFADAYRLLEPFEDTKAGDLKFDYLLARSALESGQPSRASFIYERILAVAPNYVGVRLEMGRAYYELHDYARAIAIFETVLRFQNLPPDIRKQAQAYEQAARQSLEARKTVGYGYIEASAGYDSNPLSATSVADIPLVDGSILVLPPSALKRSDHYGALAFGGEVVHALSDRISLFAGGDVRGRSYNNIDAANFADAGGRLGMGYSSGSTSVRFGLGAGHYELDGDPTRDTKSITVDGRHLLANKDLVSFSFGDSQFRFVPEGLKINDFNLYNAAIGWQRGINSGRGAVGFTLLGGQENDVGGRPDGDKPFVGIRVSLQNAFSDRMGGFLSAGTQRGKYRTTNAAFGVRREDDLSDITVGLTWSFGAGWSLRGQLQYMKNKSNIVLYEFDRTDASLTLRKDF
ncbi:MAG: tetratricopeptide repeat protein [Burkholderiales bacterium]